jgi:hypothetical protein
MLLNLIWLGFFVSAFAVALGRLAMGDMEVFPKCWRCISAAWA